MNGKRHALTNIMIALVLAGCVIPKCQAKEETDKFAIMLLNQMVGPAMKVETVLLKENGDLSDELYDITSTSKSQGLVTLRACELSASRVDSTVAAAFAMLARLPKDVDADKPVAIDGPSRAIIVIRAGDRRQSNWNSDTFHPASQESAEFGKAWSSINTLLSCDGEKGHALPRTEDHARVLSAITESRS